MNTSQPTLTSDAIEFIEDFGAGYRGNLDWRRKAIRDVAGRLEPLKSSALEAGPLLARARHLGQSIVSSLWQLLAQLESYESTVQHLYEELENTQERLSELPPFRYDEPKFIAQARYGVEKLRSSLGQELRDTDRRWLDTRGDAEAQIGELLGEYVEAFTQLHQMEPGSVPPPSLNDLLSCLSMPPATEVIVQGSLPASTNDADGGAS